MYVRLSVTGECFIQSCQIRYAGNRVARSQKDFQPKAYSKPARKEVKKQFKNKQEEEEDEEHAN